MAWRLRELCLGIGGAVASAWIVQYLIRHLRLNSATAVTDVAASRSFPDVDAPASQQATEGVCAEEIAVGLRPVENTSRDAREIIERAREINERTSALGNRHDAFDLDSGGFGESLLGNAKNASMHGGAVATFGRRNHAGPAAKAKRAHAKQPDVSVAHARHVSHPTSNSDSSSSGSDSPRKRSAIAVDKAVSAGLQRSRVTSSSNAGGLQRSQATSATCVGEMTTACAHQTIRHEKSTGMQCLHLCDFQHAREAFDRMRETASGGGFGTEEGQAHHLLGNVLEMLDAPQEEVEDAYKCALRLAHKNDAMELSFSVLMSMGSHAVRVDDVEIGEHFYLQGLSLASRVLSESEEAIAEGKLGICLGLNEGRRSECFAHFKKSISKQEHPKADPHEVLTLRSKLANALSAHGKYADAKSEYERALALARTLGDRRLEVDILTSLASLYENHLSAPDSMSQCRESLAAIRFAGTGDLCTICLAPLNQRGQQVVVLACSHSYHSSCWSSCQRETGRCPQCSTNRTLAVS